MFSWEKSVWIITKYPKHNSQKYPISCKWSKRMSEKQNNSSNMNEGTLHYSYQHLKTLQVKKENKQNMKLNVWEIFTVTKWLNIIM